MQVALVSILAAFAIAHDAVALNYLSEEYIKQINTHAKTWTAGKNFPEGTSLSHIRSLLGVRRSKVRVLGYKKRDFAAFKDEVPESFDARERWSNCSGIRQIADQSACGSCWAVATASAISDRICIHSNGAKDIPISAVDLASCCDEWCGLGCNGGYPERAWNYWERHGLVSGGAYNSGVGCKPYPFPKCSHHVNSTRFQPCQSGYYDTPKCARQCDTTKYTYKRDLHRGESSYYIQNDVKEIQIEILERGPVGADFEVYSDFPTYKSGVYQKTPNTKHLGGHAVRILGWGVENGVEYWLVANSWNDSWGDNGLFKIIRGINHLGFEEIILGGIPRH